VNESPPEAHPQQVKVCIVGAGTRFLSGISYYTDRLINALAERHRVSAILMRQLLPTKLYPGRDRVGLPLVRFDYAPTIPVLDGLDWYWGRSMPRVVRFLRRERPGVVVLQWWTGTVLHSYIALALIARGLGARVVIEFHEVLDTGELNIRPARWYVRSVAPLLMRLAHGYVVHNEFDRRALDQEYGLGAKPVAMVAHGPYDRYAQAGTGEPEPPRGPREVCHLLYFGVIRPFKGVDDLLTAFDSLSDEQAARFHLTIVGEPWEGFATPGEMVRASRHRDRITFVDRYVSENEVGAYFSAADVVVLPYRRSSASGPLHIAMANGLPVVVTSVGGLVEAIDGYEGAVTIPPRDPEAIAHALLAAYELRGRRFQDVHSWERTVDRYGELFDALGASASV
jgi:glycosyltransferase involved in cell wall biosynthesis